MSVNDEDKFPRLISEKKFIYQAVTSAKPVLGICLGAQLIASAVGARVYPRPVKEIGWFPIFGFLFTDFRQTTMKFLVFRRRRKFFIGMVKHLTCHPNQHVWLEAMHALTRRFKWAIL